MFHTKLWWLVPSPNLVLVRDRKGSLSIFLAMSFARESETICRISNSLVAVYHFLWKKASQKMGLNRFASNRYDSVICKEKVKKRNSGTQKRKNPLQCNGFSGCSVYERVVGAIGLEPTTSCMSSKRSNQLSYAPKSSISVIIQYLNFFVNTF